MMCCNKNNKTTYIIIGAVLIGIVIYFYGSASGDAKYLPWLLILLCPIMHLFMMKDRGKDYKSHNEKHNKKNEGGSCH